MLIERRSIDELLSAQYNPRLDLKSGDLDYEKLKKSIMEFDYVDPVVWNKRTGRVVGGHQRLKILKELGKKDIEVSVVDLSDDKEKALNLALNKIAGDWDLPKLKDLLEELDTGDFDIELTGFGLDEIEDLMTQFLVEPDSPEEDDFDAEAEANSIVEPTTKLGDIWILGRHRLMCGDSTKLQDVEQLMDGTEANMIFTDPPYNVDYVGKTKNSLTIKNDKMDGSKFYQFLFDALTNMFNVTTPGGAIYVCHADSEGKNFRTAMTDAGWFLKQCLIWVKNSMVMGRQDYQWKHEPILYGWKPGAPHKWFGGRANTTVWNFDKPLKNAEHPTMKPIGISAKAISNSSRRGDVILDLFCGSGSTLMAAEQLGRTCFGMELDPLYCDVIVKRWEKYTGAKAELIE